MSKGVGPPVHVIATNLTTGNTLPANWVIELAFDRLLLPASVTRQTFVSNINPPPLIAYDPVTRIVSITPQAPLVVGQTYEIQIASPQSDTDLDGLRAIDGALIDPKSAALAFQATATDPNAQRAAMLSYCTSVQPIFGNCTGSTCHGGGAGGGADILPADGLELTTEAFVASTAIGRVAHEANDGPQAQPQPPGLTFGEDMPIIDPGENGAGDPGDSWLLYKLLLAIPPTSNQAVPLYPIAWTPLSDSERAVLANYVPGREMPYPSEPGLMPEAGAGLSTQDMETLSLWIAQGAQFQGACP